MEIDFDDAINKYVTEIAEKIRETRDEFIFESLMPYAQTAESRINKQELKRAIRMFYGMENLAEVVRCKECKFYSVNGHCGVLGFCEPDEFCSRGEREEKRRCRGTLMLRISN